LPDLVVKDLHVTVEGKEILKGIDLVVRSGEVHAIIGPNGSGKSTLALTVMGHPRYKVTRGSVTFGGRDVLAMAVDERARAGLFLAFQYPAAIPGVSVANFLRTAINARRAEPGVTAGTAAEARKNDMPIPQFRKLLAVKMKLLEIDDSFITRSVNDGFSGGEKKRLETLQMHMFGPSLALLDETDSGLDIDSLKAVAMGVEQLIGPDLGVLLITHYQRILNYVTPDFVHVMIGGRIVKSGGQELAHELEEKGYEGIRQELGIEQENGEKEA
jgi:Fe-S cluster assembly ATP-binding protein